MISRLGSGGMGEVYRARDEALCRDVAIKVLATDAAREASAVERFTREAHAASALNHPNIVTVFDAGDSDSGPFLVMELIDGATLRQLPEPRDVSTIVRVGRQVAQALAVAHAAGIVHRDIKPENVMVRVDGYAKVLDFGIARVARAVTANPTAALTTELAETTTFEVVTGTIGYMSPEQARGEPVDAATDVFALGIVLYELATGHHPFAAPTPLAMAARLLAETPAPPSATNADVPRALDAVILRMLEKDPRQRPTANEVDRDLDALGTAPAIRVDRLGAKTVGRDAAHAALAAALDEAVSGRGLFVTIEGEPGIGKTTLVQEFLDTLEPAQCRVGTGRCAERHTSTAYLPWLEVLDSILNHGGSAVSHLMRTTAPTWYAQVAPLAQDESPDARALTVSRAGSQQSMIRELAQFLEQLARHSTVVLFFEDVHWADASTVDLIAYVAGRLQGTRVLAIATCRPSELRRAQHPLLPVKLDLERRGVSRAITLDFLSRGDVDRYLSGEFEGHAFPPGLAALIYAKTEGSPLFMADLVRSLRERRVIERQANGWTITRPIDAIEREMPASIRSMIELTLGRLDESDRRLLVAASIQGQEFDSAVVARSTGSDQGDVEDRLEALARLHALVQPVDELELPDRTLTVRYRFVHVLYQNALYASLGPSRRASLSGSVARALLAFHGEQGGTHAAEIASMLETARDFSGAATLYQVASEAARRVFADREALALAQRGLEMIRALPDTAERRARELIHLLGVALPMHTVKGYAAPELDETYRRAREICDEAGEHPQQFTVVTGIGAFRLMRAELRDAQVATEQMLRLAEQVGDPVMSIWTRWAFGSTYGHLLERLPEALALLDEGVHLYEPKMHARFVLMTGFDAGIACRFQSARIAWLLGDAAGAIERASVAHAAAQATEHPLMIAFAAFFLAWVHQHRRDPVQAHAAAATAVGIADRYGYPHVGAWARALDGWATGLLGDARNGEMMIREALATTDAIGVTLIRPNFLANLAELQLLNCETNAALATIDSARAIVDRTEERCYLPEILRLRAECLLRLDQNAEARTMLDEALDLVRTRKAAGFEPAIRTAMSAIA